MAYTKPEWELLNLDNNPEHDYFDNLVCERTDIGGFSIEYYVKLNIGDSDYLYGEDTTEEFSDAYYSKLIYDPTEEPDILNVFGISSDDTLKYAQMPKTIFTRDIEDEYKVDYGASSLIPKVGDVLRTQWNNKIYQIVEVSTETNIFQGIKLIWDFILKPYKHSEESESADEMLFYDPADEDFPDINETTTTTENLSAYGENQKIEDESDDISSTPDSSVYGY